jgi:zinc protease
LYETRTAPVISFNVLVYAGSAIETDSEAGMCHVIEHMIFKGTPSRKVGEVARDIEAAGGEVNAYTSFDQTVFYINMASRFADKGLEILADAVQNSLFDEAELSREIEVICEEIRRGKDNPSHCISEDLFHHSFTKHTYGRPIIGFEKTVKSFDRQRVLDFYKKHYTPHNMTLIVVGNFKPEEIKPKIETAFAGFKGGTVEELTKGIKIEAEPPQTAMRVNLSEMDIQSSHFLLGFHVPEITHKDIPALDVLSHILGGSESSRLEQVVREKKRLVHNIYSYAFTPKYPGLFMIGGVTQPEKILKTLDAVWEEVQKVMTEPVSADELGRAKVNIHASEVYERESVGGQAAKLAYFLATANDHDFEKKYFQLLNDVSVEQIRQVAEKYLNVKNCTVEVLSPKDAESKPTTEAATAACSGVKPLSRTAKIERSKPKVYHLKNGIRLVIRESHTHPIVAVYAVTPGGLIYENKKNNGISYLTSRALTKGTARRSAINVAQKIESIAGIIDGFCGRNSVGLRCEFLSDKLHDGFGLFAEVLTSPSFDDKEVDKERTQQLETIQNQEDNLHAMVFVHFLKRLYGDHPYGLRMVGEPASVKGLKASTLRRYWTEHLNPKEMVISVVGDVSPEEIKRLTEDWIRIKGHKATGLPKMHIERPSEIITNDVIKKGKEQSHIALGFLGTTIKSPDHYKMSVLNQILAGQGGRLFLTLRDKMSLAYSVNSTLQSGVEPGYFAVYIGTDPAKTDTAIKGIKKELEKITKDPVDKDELERAQQYMVGTFELDLQKNGSLASSYAFNELYGLGINEVEHYCHRIMKVTREDILKVAKKYIDMNAYVLSVIRPK